MFLGQTAHERQLLRQDVKRFFEWKRIKREDEPRRMSLAARRRNSPRSGGDDFDASGIAKLREQLLAVRPGQSESPHIGYAEA